MIPRLAGLLVLLVLCDLAMPLSAGAFQFARAHALEVAQSRSGATAASAVQMPHPQHPLPLDAPYVLTAAAGRVEARAPATVPSRAFLLSRHPRVASEPPSPEDG